MSPFYGDRMYALLKRLFPICRSITGEGLRETLCILGEEIPLNMSEVPTGTKCFDWEIPKEWVITGATLKDPTGAVLADFKAHNLHVVNYSTGIRRCMSLSELRPHLHTREGLPEAIPYVTSYYQDNWGFCLPHRIVESLPEGDYEVAIDAAHVPGSLTYADCLLPGKETAEVVISCYVCHPSMANDSLSGVVVATQLAKLLRERKRRFSYRFIFVPETIGAIAYLAQHGDHLKAHTHAGLVLTCCGDQGDFTYKRSRRGTAVIDRIVEHVLRHSGYRHDLIDFHPRGSDERQYCSPGFDLPVGGLTRTPYERFKEYHTSLDNLDFVSREPLGETLDVCLQVVDALEANACYARTEPHCEPQLGKRGLYPQVGDAGMPEEHRREVDTLLCLLNYCDGTRDLLWIADRLGVPITGVARHCGKLIEAGLLARAGGSGDSIGVVEGRKP